MIKIIYPFIYRNIIFFLRANFKFHFFLPFKKDKVSHSADFTKIYNFINTLINFTRHETSNLFFHFLISSFKSLSNLWRKLVPGPRDISTYFIGTSAILSWGYMLVLSMTSCLKLEFFFYMYTTSVYTFWKCRKYLISSIIVSVRGNLLRDT